MTPSEAIAKLKKSGMTEAAIASKVGAGQPTVNKILRSVMQPNWALGQKLVALAKRRCGRKKASAIGDSLVATPKRKKAA